MNVVCASSAKKTFYALGVGWRTRSPEYGEENRLFSLQSAARVDKVMKSRATAEQSPLSDGLGFALFLHIFLWAVSRPAQSCKNN